MRDLPLGTVSGKEHENHLKGNGGSREEEESDKKSAKECDAVF